MLDDLSKQKINFLIKALDDTQQIIKFADTKLSISLLLFGIFTSVIGSGLPSFVKYFFKMPSALKVIFIIVLLMFLITASRIFVITMSIIFPKSNPAKHVQIKNQPKGLFYLYKLKKGILTPSFEEYKERFSKITTMNDIEDELIYELLKTSYIREFKIRRIQILKKWLYLFLILCLAMIILHSLGLAKYLPVKS